MCEARGLANNEDNFDDIDNINNEVLRHELWNEIDHRRNSNNDKEGSSDQRTLLTSHAMKCFLKSFPKWGKPGFNIVKEITITPSLQAWQQARRAALNLSQKHTHDYASTFQLTNGKLISRAASMLQQANQSRYAQYVLQAEDLKGKAVVVRKHNHYCTMHPCKCEAKFAFVVALGAHEDLATRWLTLPRDTICAGFSGSRDPRKQMPFYPIGNELFFTNECSHELVNVSDVLAVYSITVGRDHAEPGHELFVHRQYCAGTYAITTISPSILDCCPEHDTYLPDEPTKLEGLEEIEAKATILSIFSGCGLFDLGIEHGSGRLFKIIYAADLDRQAHLSHKANCPYKDKCEFHNEDVNKLLKQICASTNLPEVDIFVAGCPCQGFSRRNEHKNSKGAAKNCSLLAHTLSWIELLSPMMVLIENVIGMDETNPSSAGQAICYLVSIGYQVTTITIKASDFGGATSRERLFLVATVPGIPLPEIPDATHGAQQDQWPASTTSSITADLPAVTNSTILNILHPDHFPVDVLKAIELSVVSKIPTTVEANGHMSNLASVMRILNDEERNWVHTLTDEKLQKNSGAYKRMNPRKPMSTILTSVVPEDSRSSGVIHWSQHRVVTLEELRRFQGVPEWFVLIGSKNRHIAQIGNSVAWATSTLLGKAFAEAWRRRKLGVAPSAKTNGDDRAEVADLSNGQAQGQTLGISRSPSASSLDVTSVRASPPPTNKAARVTDWPEQNTVKRSPIQNRDDLRDPSQLLTPPPSRGSRIKKSQVIATRNFYTIPNFNVGNDDDLPGLDDILASSPPRQKETMKGTNPLQLTTIFNIKRTPKVKVNVLQAPTRKSQPLPQHGSAATMRENEVKVIVPPTLSAKRRATSLYDSGLEADETVKRHRMQYTVNSMLGKASESSSAANNVKGDGKSKDTAFELDD